MLAPLDLHLIFQVLVNYLLLNSPKNFAKDSFGNPLSFYTQ